MLKVYVDGRIVPLDTRQDRENFIAYATLYFRYLDGAETAAEERRADHPAELEGGITKPPDVRKAHSNGNAPKSRRGGKSQYANYLRAFREIGRPATGEEVLEKLKEYGVAPQSQKPLLTVKYYLQQKTKFRSLGVNAQQRGIWEPLEEYRKGAETTLELP